MEWVMLEDLPDGALFETRSRVRAVKSKYRYMDGGIECVEIDTGEYAHFSDMAYEHNATEVRELMVGRPVPT